ncbi:MAG: ATP-binding protein [Bacteroidia bacterium]|nr:ATP-binding protein [Bacteroidia bacterium]
MQKLPVGIQSFREIREKGYLYIDKTEQVYSLISASKYTFLSRPRRFGKSLLISTIKELFLGSRKLFEGLWVSDQWDWTETHPVIQVGFSSLGYETIGLEKAIEVELDAQASRLGIALSATIYDRKFKELIEKTFEKHGQVVILVDEYDKPLIDYLGADLEKAKAHQKILEAFYGVIKDADPFIQFMMVTGVSRFSKVSIFSDLNNLHDISRHQDYSDMLGITEEEITDYLGEYLDRIEEEKGISSDLLRAQMRDWYNGYSWDGETRVYNPFSLLIFCSEREFKNYWFETGTPSFLLALMKQASYYQLENLEVDELAFSAYDIENLRALPILFQTGYLTIREKKKFGQYLLDYPNKEVRDAMYGYLIGDLRQEDPSFSSSLIMKIGRAFSENNLEELMLLFQTLFARIPYDLFIANLEAYYHSLLYLTFQFLGSFQVESEVHTNRGRIDAVVHTAKDIYVIEFKLDEPASVALAQIHDRQYAERFRDAEKTVHLLGISFGSKERSVVDWVEEILA